MAESHSRATVGLKVTKSNVHDMRIAFRRHDFDVGTLPNPDHFDGRKRYVSLPKCVARRAVYALKIESDELEAKGHEYSAESHRRLADDLSEQISDS